MRRHKTIGTALIVVSLMTLVGVAAATLSSGVSVEPIGVGTIARDFKVPQNDGEGVVIARYTIEPGGTTGWHSHPGKAVVAIHSGELTITRAVRGECRTRTYGPGEGFVEIPSVVHMARNDGDTPLVFGAALFRIPASGVTRIDQAEPAAC
ncbi:MAG TPA: cupin domain-containing protein [Actinomycetota bacterium]|nr:cupin domain-containing protein [Actinomycetota bacterium]